MPKSVEDSHASTTPMSLVASWSTCVSVMQPLQVSDKSNALAIELNVIMATKSLHHNLIHDHYNNEEQRKTRKQRITENNMDDETVYE